MNRLAEKISVIVPCFNEGPRIRKNLAEVCDFLSSFTSDYELIAVDDGSSDETLAEIGAAASDYPSIRGVHYEENVGKGNALREGFEHVSGHYVVFLDADLDLHPRQLAGFFETMRHEEAAVVIGSKRHPDSKVDYPKRRRLISRLYSFFLRLLFDLPLRDTQTGLKLFKYEVLEKVFSKIVCKRFAFDVELLANAHRLGYKIVEAPIELNFTRILRRGRITMADLWNTGWDTLAIFYRMKALRYYDRAHLAPSQFPRVSVVVVARGQEPGLKECVEGCLRQNYASEFEVLLVVNEPLEFEMGGSLKVVETQLGDKSSKREMGSKQARYEVIAFLDAPLVPGKNWLARAARNFGDSEIAAVSGPRLPTPAVAYERLPGWKLATTLLGDDALRFRYISKARQAKDYCASDNFIVRRSSLQDIVKNLHSPECFGDAMLGRTVTQQMKRIIAYDPEVIVYRSRHV